MMNEAMGGMETEGQDQGTEASAGEGRSGSSVCINCYQDGTYDVYSKPLEPASEQQYPDGAFGLESLEDALKAVIALKQSGQDFRQSEHDDMMNSFEGKDEDQGKPAMSGGY